MRSSHILAALFLFYSSINLSCSRSFLETPPITNIESSTFLDNLRLDGCSQLLYGSYQELGQNVFHGLNYAYPDLTSDNLKPINTVFNQQYSWNQIAFDGAVGRTPSSSSTDMSSLWNAGFHLLRNIALVLENVDKYRSDNEVKADSIKGQSLALRGLTHWFMVNVYAQPYNFTSDASHPGIPYVIESDYTIYTPRSSVFDVYKSIIEDFENSRKLLPKNANAKTTINYYAVTALLARVYFYKGDFEAARNLAIEVITAVPIMKINYPSKLFTNQETEALFQLPPASTGVNGATYTTNFLGLYLASGTSQAFYATKDIVDIIRERPSDVRSSWFTAQGANWRVAKFPINVIPGFPNQANSYYQTIIRSSEVCLIAAECYARLKDEGNSIYYLDQIRKRADITALSTTATGKNLLDSIAKERRKELCFEAQRMFDLLRVKKGVIRIDASNSSVTTLSYPNNKAISPLPRRDVEMVGYEQNKDY